MSMLALALLAAPTFASGVVAQQSPAAPAPHGAAPLVVMSPTRVTDGVDAIEPGTSAVVTDVVFRINEDVGQPQPGQALLFGSLVDYRATPTAGVTAILDLERWDRTPRFEQRHPFSTFADFIELAHARGDRAVIAPGFGLGLRLPCSRDLNPIPAYIRCWSRVSPDLILVQGQHFQEDVPTYRRLMDGGNDRLPGIVVPEMSIREEDGTRAHHLIEAWKAVRGLAAGVGLWSSITTTNYQPGVRFLRWLAQSSGP